MAYSRKTRSRSYSRRPVRSRSRRYGTRPVRRARRSSTRSRTPQTIRIVLEQPGSSLARPEMLGLRPVSSTNHRSPF